MGGTGNGVYGSTKGHPGRAKLLLLLRNSFRFDKRQSYAFYSICASEIRTKGIHYYICSRPCTFREMGFGLGNCLMLSLLAAILSRLHLFPRFN